MINTLALTLIADIMNWDTDTATREYAWLQLISSAKYDGYSDFRAGVRFLESLATWLRQFDEQDRQAAYDFVKNRLVYVSSLEMKRLIEAFLPETVTPYLRRTAAKEVGVEPYEVWGHPEGAKSFRRKLRRCLFIGLSDGSRIDTLRRTNSGLLSQEQVIPMMNIDDRKWRDLASKLKNESGSDNAHFDDVYLIDDFTASGTTFIRNVGGAWKGKLKKFNDMVCQARGSLGDEFPISPSYKLHIHHYISTHQAREALNCRVQEAEEQWKDRSFSNIEISEGTRLPLSLKMNKENDAAMLDLCDRYYDDELYQRLKEHCDEAGQDSMKLGYANCALPLVLEHNTPNNSIPLLWAETSGKQGGHAMRPLFRRRDRHG